MKRNAGFVILMFRHCRQMLLHEARKVILSCAYGSVQIEEQDFRPIRGAFHRQRRFRAHGCAITGG